MNKEERGCLSKRRYKTREAALKQRGFEEIEPYECKYCGGWHNGHHILKEKQHYIDQGQHVMSIGKMLKRKGYKDD